MTEQESETPFDKLCLDVLQSIGKTLSRMNLYSAKHPAVAAMISESGGFLGQALKEAESGRIAYSIDQGKVIANGRIAGELNRVPNSVSQLFNRFKLNSMTFSAGITDAELAALCELAALRPEAAKDVAASNFLAERGVEHVSLNEALYAKVESLADEDRPAQITGEAVEAFSDSIKDKPLEKIIKQLVESMVPDPADREKIIQAVLDRIQEELQEAVKEATVELNKEKTVLSNEATRTHAVIGNMADGVVTVDDQGQVLMMNPEAEDLFGSRMAEMVGKGLPEFVKDDQMMAMSKELAIPDDKTIEGRGAIDAQGGAKATLRASTVVVKNEAGKPVGMVAAVTDKAKQRELLKQEREFVSHVTHELRAPLASIIAALELLNDEAADHLKGAAGKMMASAMRNADRLEQLINGILDFGKIESGQMTVTTKPFDAEQIAREAVESLQPWAHKKGLHLRLEARPGLPPVSADVGRSVQVLVNMISNAIKFSPRGETIYVRVRPGAEPERFVQYSVKDGGPGIAEEEQPKVFEKFVQIQSGEMNVGGTGLGLAIAKALVHLQKGEMWLVSEMGKGAEFLFTLPRYVEPEGKNPAKKESASKSPPWWKRFFGFE